MPNHCVFSLQYPVSAGCGGRLTGTGGLVHYPPPGVERYDHNVSCSWRITVPDTMVVNITFTEFHLESGRCVHDWLQVRYTYFFIFIAFIYVHSIAMRSCKILFSVLLANLKIL